MSQSAAFTRRQFLRWACLAGAAAVAANMEGPVKSLPPVPTGMPTAPRLPAPRGTPVPSPSATFVPATLAPTRAPHPSPNLLRFGEEPAAAASATPAPPAQVALAQARTYEAVALRLQLEAMLERLGGLSQLVRPGARVGLKVNLTGGTWWDAPGKPLATETFVTHPAVVGALIELLKDAGASRIYIMEGAADETAWDKWGYTAMARPLGAEIVSLCQPAPYLGFATVPVGSLASVYRSFTMNGRLQDVDVFVSIAKMKCHAVAGVTLALKNLIGLTPIDAYKRNPQDTNRSAFHGKYDYDTRLPRVIVDLNLARPIDLAVIDGVITCEAGAGPWDKALTQVSPGLLVAGRDPVATDTVATALMGFDPQAAAQALPFIRSDNHLALAEAAGLGSNRLDEITVAGGSVEDLRFPFKPAA